jgi:DNA polymerase sigma
LIEAPTVLSKTDIERKLENEISMLYGMLQPTEEQMINLLNTYQEFNSIVSLVMERIGLKFDLIIYGSSVNGLALRGDSDLDLSLVVHDLPELASMQEQELSVRRLLESVASAIRTEPRFASRFKLTQGELQVTSFGYLMQVRDTAFETDIDLSVNKILDPYNSSLIQTYSRLDERFHKLALVLKQWNKMRFEQKNERLNSYSIVLLLIAYLQHKKVLPCLQQINRKDGD